MVDPILGHFLSGHFLSILLDLGLRMCLVGLVSDRTLEPSLETDLLHQQGNMVF